MKFSYLMTLATFALAVSADYKNGKVTVGKGCTAPDGCASITQAAQLVACLKAAKEAGCESADFEREYANIAAPKACTPPKYLRQLEAAKIPKSKDKSTIALGEVRSDGGTDTFAAGKLSIIKLKGIGAKTEKCKSASLFSVAGEDVCNAAEGDQLELEAADTSIDMKTKVILADDVKHLLIVGPTNDGELCGITEIALTASTAYDLKDATTTTSTKPATPTTTKTASTTPHGGDDTTKKPLTTQPKTSPISSSAEESGSTVAYGLSGGFITTVLLTLTALKLI